MIFIDRSLTEPVARALQKVRDDVRWLEDLFPPNTLAEVWLADIGARGWMVISRDKGIRHKPREKQDLSKFNLLRIVVLNMAEMERRFAEEERPFIYLIDQHGAFRPVAL